MHDSFVRSVGSTHINILWNKLEKIYLILSNKFIINRIKLRNYVGSILTFTTAKKIEMSYYI